MKCENHYIPIRILTNENIRCYSFHDMNSTHEDFYDFHLTNLFSNEIATNKNYLRHYSLRVENILFGATHGVIWQWTSTHLHVFVFIIFIIFLHLFVFFICLFLPSLFESIDYWFANCKKILNAKQYCPKNTVCFL